MADTPRPDLKHRDDPRTTAHHGVVTTDDLTHQNPGTNVTGSDTPGGGGIRPLEISDDGHPLKPTETPRPDSPTGLTDRR